MTETADGAFKLIGPLFEQIIVAYGIGEQLFLVALKPAKGRFDFFLKVGELGGFGACGLQGLGRAHNGVLQAIDDGSQIKRAQFIAIFFSHYRIALGDEFFEFGSRLSKLTGTQQHGIGRSRQVFCTQDKGFKRCDVISRKAFERVGTIPISGITQGINQCRAALFGSSANGGDAFAVLNIHRLGKQQDLIGQAFKFEGVVIGKADKICAFGDAISMTAKPQKIG